MVQTEPINYKNPKINRIFKIVFGLFVAEIILAIWLVANSGPIRMSTANQVYDLGRKYFSLGRCEQARTMLDIAATIGRGTQAEMVANRFKETRIPLSPVPAEAVEQNIRAYNLSCYNKSEKAEKLWLKCVEQYPNFEWPYGNLSQLYLSQERYDEAEKYGLQGLKINPVYVNELVTMAYVKWYQGEPRASRVYAWRALQADPTDAGAIKFNKWLEQLPTGPVEKLKKKPPL